ncbi:MAG: phosphoribosylamine--glycine ligase [Bacteroidia bacterium]|nr:phosphoribosylamine--glycine ligase [Bacteroidia bacterium]
MNVLLLGSGGREHAFAKKISESKLLNQLYILPGNAGTARCGQNLEGSPNDAEAIKKIVWEKDIHCIVVGPEEPLVKGLKDALRKDDVLRDVIFVGPDAGGAALEGSKAFAKNFMKKYGIPTARFKEVNETNIHEGIQFLESLQPPYVLKADGLAGGKGVLILNNPDEAKEELKNFIFKNKMGDAGKVVVIEEFLQGIECSCFVFTDGIHYQLLPFAKDYKRIGDGDTGPNTGGMGAVSPVPFADEDFVHKVRQRIIEPTLESMRLEGCPYEGFLFIGLMNVGGDPYVIEFNCRMGDPETEAIFPRIKSDFLEWFKCYHEKKLNQFVLDIDPRTACVLIMASKGYPDAYEKNKPITISSALSGNCMLFAAGIRATDEGWFTNGGRVLALCSLADTLHEARSHAYSEIQKIHFENAYFRTDIGADLLKYY